jgi:hypothetical protein
MKKRQKKDASKKRLSWLSKDASRSWRPLLIKMAF